VKLIVLLTFWLHFGITPVLVNERIDVDSPLHFFSILECGGNSAVVFRRWWGFE
jgi:hypothetical protein